MHSSALAKIEQQMAINSGKLNELASYDKVTWKGVTSVSINKGEKNLQTLFWKIEQVMVYDFCFLISLMWLI